MVKHIFDLFIEKLKLIDKPSTVSQYYSLGKNHILNKFNDRDMSTISEEEIISHILHEKNNTHNHKSLSPKTLYDITTLINTFWAYAYEKGCIREKIKISTPKVIRSKVQVFNTDERKAIEELILKDITPYGIAILLCLYTGLRIGEICALQWQDIDLSLGIIYINKTIIRVKNLDKKGKTKTKVIICIPKSETSIRAVPIPNVLIPILNQVKCNNNCYLATGTTSFMEVRLLQKKYRTLLAQKVQYKNFHTLRHTFATNACNNGMSIKILSEILGHADVKTTLNLYVHTSIEQKQKEMNHIYTAKPTS